MKLIYKVLSEPVDRFNWQWDIIEGKIKTSREFSSSSLNTQLWAEKEEKKRNERRVLKLFNKSLREITKES